MPLQSLPEPKNGASLVLAELRRITAHHRQLADLIGDLDAIRLLTPHEVYSLSANEIVESGSLTASVKTGVRYLIEANGNVVAAAEIKTDSSGDAVSLARINGGFFVGATAAALQRLEQADLVRAQSYKWCLLLVPSIYFVALWLRPVSHHAELIYPLANLGEIQSGRLYQIDELFALLRPIAGKRISAFAKLNTPKGRPPRHPPSR